MALKIAQKKEIVLEVNEVAKRSVSAIAADYKGVTVSEMTGLRADARKAGITLRVVRNTLARRAFTDNDFKCLHDSLTGQVLLAFAEDEPSAPARLFRDFMKENKTLEIRAIAIGGDLYSASQLDVIAKLPTKDEAISRLMAVMQAPITKLVRTLAEPQAKLVRVLAAIKDKQA